MKVVPVTQNTDDWMSLRIGKITGSKLHGLYSKNGSKKIGFYQLIADRLALADDTVDGRDRGHETEEEAIEQFESLTGKKIERDCGMWLSDDNENIAVSPDGAIKSGRSFKEAVEVKCLGSARHIEAIITNKIPGEYYEQAIQYFVVNEKLEKLYFVFYDPRVTVKPMHVIEVDRDKIESEIEYYRNYEKEILEEVNRIVEELVF